MTAFTAYRYRPPIRVPGAYVDVPIEAYHGQPCDGPSVSSTGLKRVLRSPAHYFARSPLNPNRAEDQRSDALDLGQAAHCAALEPDAFEERHVVCPFDSYRSKDAQAWKAEMHEAGKLILTEEQRSTVFAMAAELRRHPIALALFRGGVAELTFAAKDEPTGLWTLARPDFCPAAAERGLVDYKTAADASPESFGKAAFNYGYEVQVALALETVERATGERRPTFWMVVQEKEPPFAVAVYEWTPEQITWGRRKMRDALDILAGCIERGVWPGYSTDPQPLSAPVWINKQIEAEAA